MDPAHHLQIGEQQIHLRVADALADRQPRAVQAMRASFSRRDGVDDAQAAITVAVPINLYILAGRGHHFAHESNQRAHAVRCGVADGIADANVFWLRS